MRTSTYQPKHIAFHSSWSPSIQNHCNSNNTLKNICAERWVLCSGCSTPVSVYITTTYVTKTTWSSVSYQNSTATATMFSHSALHAKPKHININFKFTVQNEREQVLPHLVGYHWRNFSHRTITCACIFAIFCLLAIASQSRAEAPLKHANAKNYLQFIHIFSAKKKEACIFFNPFFIQQPCIMYRNQLITIIHHFLLSFFLNGDF